MDKDRFSIIIRIKNEEQWIGHCIQSVLDNFYKPEIVIVDNCSNDNSVNIIKLFREDPDLNGTNKNYTNIKFVTIQDYSPGRSINLGVKNCSNDYVMILSAHCILKKINFLKHIEDLKKNIAIFGKQNPIYMGKKIVRKYIWKHFIDEEKINMFSDYENRFFFHNALSLFKKKTLIDYPFDENLTSKEDRYWVKNIIEKKFKFKYDPALEADHHFTINGNSWRNF